MVGAHVLLAFLVTAFPEDSVKLDSIGYDFPPDFPIEPPVELTEELQDDTGGAGFMERLRWIQDHPYDLNRVTPAELLTLPDVTEGGVDAISGFRKENHRFRSVDQLLTIPGGGVRLYRALRPFVMVSGAAGEVKEGLTIRSRAVESFPGNPSSAGSPVYSYTRVSLGWSPGIEAGGVFEKDAGELTRNAFLSGYVRARGLWGMVDVIAGDYSLESGQGLVLWGGTTISKSASSATMPRKSARGIVPHRSSEELYYLRGVAASIDFPGAAGRWQGLAFLSHRSIAASMNEAGEITSILASGTYDTESLASRQDALHEHVAGGPGWVCVPGDSLPRDLIRAITL